MMFDMDRLSKDTLTTLTTEFYAQCAQSFSLTREHPWLGWKGCIDCIDTLNTADELSVLDIACGNLRFEAFLAKNLSATLDFYAIDSCPQMLDKSVQLNFFELDIIHKLDNKSFYAAIESIPLCDIVCSFGFFHHIPGIELRYSLLDAMLNKTKQSGYILISLWQFAKNEKLLTKAKATTEHACNLYPELHLEQGDWLLGWQNNTNLFRYCHSFDDDEIDALINYVSDKAKLTARFNADGKDNDLNCYLIFEKK